MATTQLSITNDALGFLEERRLVATTDATEPARVMLALWDHVIKYCLEQGHWKFAEREALLVKSVVEIPTFGYVNAFAQPTDYVRLNQLSSDEYFNTPLFNVHEKFQHWYTDQEELYVRYTSNDAAYGGDVTLWPESFTLLVTVYLAVRAAPRVKPDLLQALIKSGGGIGLENAKLNALSKDAVAGPTQFLPQGNWLRARGDQRRGRNSRASLYGS